MGPSGAGQVPPWGFHGNGLKPWVEPQDTFIPVVLVPHLSSNREGPHSNEP
jgi:hypothetical protein